MPRPLDIAGLAHAYRRLVLWVGVQLLVNCGGRAVIASAGAGGQTETALLIGFGLGVATTVAALVYYGYKTAGALGSDLSVLWAIAMLIPCANIITLLVLSSKATSVCRANGIAVGLLGPKV